MARFKLSRYVQPKEGSGSDEPIKQEKEVRFVALKDSPASELLAKTLFEKLRRRGIELIESEYSEGEGPEKEGDIGDDVRIVSMEDVAGRPGEYSRFVNQGKTVIISGTSKKPEDGDTFVRMIDPEGRQILYGLDKYVDMVEHGEWEVTMDDHEGEDEIVKLNFKVDDVVVYQGRTFNVKYVNAYIALIHRCEHEYPELPMDYEVVKHEDIILAPKEEESPEPTEEPQEEVKEGEEDHHKEDEGDDD